MEIEKFEDLSPELQEKVQNAESVEELLQIVQESGHKLTEEELEEIAMSGGWKKPKFKFNHVRFKI